MNSTMDRCESIVSNISYQNPLEFTAVSRNALQGQSIKEKYSSGSARVDTTVSCWHVICLTSDSGDPTDEKLTKLGLQAHPAIQKKKTPQLIALHLYTLSKATQNAKYQAALHRAYTKPEDLSNLLLILSPPAWSPFQRRNNHSASQQSAWLCMALCLVLPFQGLKASPSKRLLKKLSRKCPRPKAGRILISQRPASLRSQMTATFWTTCLFFDKKRKKQECKENQESQNVSLAFLEISLPNPW